MLAILAALGFAGTAMAQQKRGEINLYGDIGGTDDTDTTTISAGFGVYMTPNLVLRFSYLYSYTLDASNAETEMDTLGIGARYYFSVGKTGEFVPFVGGNLTRSTIYTYSPPGSSNETSGSGTEFELGCSYFVSETASFDLKYYKRSTDFDGTSVDSSGINFGTTIRF